LNYDNDDESGYVMIDRTQHVPVIIDNFAVSSQSRKLTLKDSKVILEMLVMCALLVGIGLASAYI
jgi:hypothetical protein